MAKRAAGGTPAVRVLERAGAPHTLHPYEHDPRTASYGLEAADALGVDPARVFKTLLAQADGARRSVPADLVALTSATTAPIARV